MLHVTRDSFKNDVEVKLLDDDVGFDDIIGSCTFSLLPYMREAATYRTRKSKKAKPVPVKSFSLKHRNKICGELRMSVQFLPAGSLTVKVVRAKGLRNPDRTGEPDPYVTLTMESLVPSLQQQFTTLTHDNGGSTPIWNAIFNFDIVDQTEVVLKVFDEDFGLDDLIGSTNINIVDVIRDLGAAEGWHDIFYKSGGKRKVAGKVFLEFSFEGYPKIRYPQYRPNLDGSDRVIDCLVEEKPVTAFENLARLPDYDPLTMAQGRLHLTFDRCRCVTYCNGIHMDNFPWIYVKIYLGGGGSKPVEFRTRSAKNCVCNKLGGKGKAGMTAIFHQEQKKFDLVGDISALIREGSHDFDLVVELWEERMPVLPLTCNCHKLLGRLKIDLVPILSNPFRAVDDWFALQEECNESSGGAIKMKLKFEAGRHGMIILTLIEGKGLRNTAGLFGWLLNDKMDPYVKAEFGRSQTARSKTINDGGTAPNFFNEHFFLWSGSIPGNSGLEMWQEPLKITIYDDDLGKDALVGCAELDLLQYFGVEEEDTNKLRKIALKKKGQDAGELIYRLDFVPAGKLSVWVKGGRGLRSADLVGKQDPYVTLEVTSAKCEAAKKKVKTKVHQNGGRDPIWNECFEFDIVDQYEIAFKCFDSDFGGDDLIGETNFSLMDTFRQGLVTSHVPLTYAKSSGVLSSRVKREPAGEILCVFHFSPNPVEGTPWGWKYPNQG